MWQLIIHIPEKEPRLIELKSGSLTLGRADTNDIIVEDISASRQHAELVYDSSTNTVTIIDLSSTNGTFVNHKRITGPYQVNSDDNITIGQFTMQLHQYIERNTVPNAPHPGTHPLTRELLLEMMYKNSVQIYEAAIKLNSVLSIDAAIETVTDVLKQAFKIDYCAIILADRLFNMRTNDFIDPLAKRAANNSSAELTDKAMFIPIEFNEETLGLISMTNSHPDARPFDQRDLRLAIAISHQAGLAIQRVQLLEHVHREEQAERLLLRFVSPDKTESLLKEFYENGELPGLKDQEVTVLFAEITNSTGLAKDLGTEHFSKILNGFYQVATQAIFAHGGVVKYSGEGVLAMFAEDPDDISPEEKAVLTGRELISMLNRTGSLDPKQRIIIGASINTGNAMVGYVGMKEFAEFNVMGDTVTLAHRMREFSNPYKIIVGHSTVTRLSEKYRFKPIGMVNLNETEQPLQIYELLP